MAYALWAQVLRVLQAGADVGRGTPAAAAAARRQAAHARPDQRVRRAGGRDRGHLVGHARTGCPERDAAQLRGAVLRTAVRRR